MSADLSLVPTDDLIAALKERSDACIVAMEFREARSDRRNYDFSGGIACALGLCELFRGYLRTLPAPAAEDEF